jgi:HSP20 family protein
VFARRAEQDVHLCVKKDDRKTNASIAAEAYQGVERSFGAFRRSFTLPVWVDASRVAAAYQDGVLTITLPRHEDTRARQIEVNG